MAKRTRFYGIVLVWLFLIGIQGFHHNPSFIRALQYHKQIENNLLRLQRQITVRISLSSSSISNEVAVASADDPLSVVGTNEDGKLSLPLFSSKRTLNFAEGKFNREDYKYLEIYFGLSSVDTDPKSQELYALFRDIHFNPKFNSEALSRFVEVVRVYLVDCDENSQRFTNRVLATKIHSILFIYDRLLKKIQRRRIITSEDKAENEQLIRIWKSALTQSDSSDGRNNSLFKPFQSLLFKYFHFPSLSYYVQNRILELNVIDGDVNQYLLNFYRCILRRITFLEDFTKGLGALNVTQSQPLDDSHIIVRNFRAKNILLGKLLGFIGVSQLRYRDLPSDILSSIETYITFIHQHNLEQYMSRSAIEDLFYVKNDYYLHFPKPLQQLLLSIAPGGKVFQRIYDRYNPALAAASSSHNASSNAITNPFLYNVMRGLGEMGFNGYDFPEEQLLRICDMNQKEILSASASLPVQLQYFYSLYSMYFFEMSNHSINRRLTRLFFQVFPFPQSHSQAVAHADEQSIEVSTSGRRRMRDLSRGSFAMILHIFGDIFSVVKLEKEKGKWNAQLEKDLFGENFDREVFLEELYEAIPVLFSRNREKSLFEILTIFHQMEVRWLHLPAPLQDYLTSAIIELLPNFIGRGEQLFDVIYLITGNLYHPDAAVFHSPLYQRIINCIKRYFHENNVGERRHMAPKSAKDMLKHYLFVLKFIFRKTQEERNSSQSLGVSNSREKARAIEEDIVNRRDDHQDVDDVTQLLLARKDQEEEQLVAMEGVEEGSDDVENDDKDLDSSPTINSSQQVLELDDREDVHTTNSNHTNVLFQSLTPMQRMQKEVIGLILQPLFNESLRQQTQLSELIEETAALWEKQPPLDHDDISAAIFQSPSSSNKRFSKYKYEAFFSYTALTVAIIGNTGLKLRHQQAFLKKVFFNLLLVIDKLYQLLSQHYRYTTSSNSSPSSKKGSVPVPSTADVVPNAYYRSLSQIFYGLRHFSIPYYRLPSSLRRLFFRSIEDMHHVVDRGTTYTTMLSFLSYLNDYDRRTALRSQLFQLRSERRSRTSASSILRAASDERPLDHHTTDAASSGAVSGAGVGVEGKQKVAGIRWNDFPYQFKARVISMIHHMIDSSPAMQQRSQPSQPQPQQQPSADEIEGSSAASVSSSSSSQIPYSSSPLPGVRVFSPVISVTCDSHPYAIEILKLLIYLNRFEYFNTTLDEAGSNSSVDSQSSDIGEEEIEDPAATISEVGSSGGSGKWTRLKSRELLHQKMICYLREAFAIIEAKPVEGRTRNEANFLQSLDYLNTLSRLPYQTNNENTANNQNATAII